MRDELVQKLEARSGAMCEAMVSLPGGVWTRCGRTPVHIHHALRRSHGGELLDAAGEDYHLVILCYLHHEQVHKGHHPDSGLLLDGNVFSGPVYVGSDEYLSSKYPPKERHATREEDEDRQG